MKIVKTVSRVFESICRNFIIAVFSLMTFSALSQVFTRTVLNNTWKWTDEMCRYCLVWLAFISAGYGVKTGSHLVIDIVVGFLPRRLKKPLSVFSRLVIIFFSSFIVYHGANLCARTLGERSAVMEVPIGLVYLAVPIAGTFMAIFAVTELILTDLGGWNKTAE